jgi:hypothetical protein
MQKMMSGPIFVFHGTSREEWSQPQNQRGPTSLYLAYDRTVARSYAIEKAQKGLTPIMVKFPLDPLIRKLREMWADDEIDVVNWREALYGVFSIYGMIDEIKSLGAVEPVAYQPLSKG